jgi:hypothetical protein
VQLNHIAQHFPVGNRFRISISTSYWPLAWPPPEPVRLSLFLEKSRLALPVRRPRKSDDGLPAFEEPIGALPIQTSLLQPKVQKWRVIRDLAEDTSTLEVVKDEGTIRYDEIDWMMSSCCREWYTFQANDFGSVRGETIWNRSFQRKDWSVKTITRTVLTADATHFILWAELDAFEGDRRVYSQDWQFKIPRDHV